MKVLVISDDMVGKALVQVLNLFTNAFLASHNEGPAVFLNEEPTHVVVLDYDEHEGHGRFNQGQANLEGYQEFGRG